MKALQAIALVAMTLILVASARAEAPKAAVFPFELDDTSLQGSMQGPQKADQIRLAHLTAQLTDALARSGQYQPVAAIPPSDNTLRTCDGCEVAIARKLGARVSVIGWVQKVSDLILNINVVIRDVATGKRVRAGSVDIRGDTDESWSRGVAYLMRYRILAIAGVGAMTLMLASVTGPEEAEVALAGDADIIDLKDPSRGALGAVSPQTVRQAVKAIGGRRAVSAVTGDLPMQPDCVRAAVAAMAETGVDYVKIGLFDGGDVAGCIGALASLATQARLIGVLFADASPDLALLERLAAGTIRRCHARHIE